MARHLPPADLLNTPRIEQLLRDGKLYLSMNDAVALALENNLDIAISRYNLNIADTDVLRANAGANTLGVSLGLLQGTPGGNAGGLGGTDRVRPWWHQRERNGRRRRRRVRLGHQHSGGRAADHQLRSAWLRGALQFDHNNILSSSTFAQPNTIQNTTTANFTICKASSGASTCRWDLTTTAAPPTRQFAATLSPTLGSNFQARITQHLLQGFGFAPNTRFIQHCEE